MNKYVDRDTDHMHMHTNGFSPAWLVGARRRRRRAATSLRSLHPDARLRQIRNISRFWHEFVAMKCLGGLSQKFYSKDKPVSGCMRINVGKWASDCKKNGFVTPNSTDRAFLSGPTLVSVFSSGSWIVKYGLVQKQIKTCTVSIERIFFYLTKHQ